MATGDLHRGEMLRTAADAARRIDREGEGVARITRKVMPVVWGVILTGKGLAHITPYGDRCRLREL